MATCMMALVIGDLFPMTLLEEMLADGYVRRFEHDNGDLVGYNYSERTQWDRVWNECTLQCRGIIADSAGNVLARPFPKFFNLGDDPETDAKYHGQPFELREKLDGSLGILFMWEGEHHISTKGAFHSAQAEWATERIRSVGPPPRADEITYLFEIIYPDNQIIVDYSGREELVLLDALRISDGSSVRTDWTAIARSYDLPPNAKAADIREMFEEFDDGNFEGFVAVYSDGRRVKVKLGNYVRAHRILTSTSNKSVWESLAAGDQPDIFGATLPDEFHEWVRDEIEAFTTKFAAIESDYADRFSRISHLLHDRRTFAEEALKADHPNILFLMADGKDYTETIWKLLRPDEIAYPPSHI